MHKTIHVSTFIPAPPATVFDVFTHYHTYRQITGVRSTRLIQAGQPEEANGLGAIREIDLGFAVFHEQVTAFHYPDYWDYHFIKWPLPLTHIGGRMSFKAVSGGTQMTWESTVEIKGLAKVVLPWFAWFSGYGLKLASIQMKRIVLQKINAR
ncbi:SRPBCC family protein [Acinetobacter sp. ANC 3882]|uniref:SRPBCC family protein n=1 Tax=Acinetobacter sp. ANC 3882 TaxID=2923423 RepID=UPI001F4A19F0|nr:SRPBCC family protein [Acinetobacter sp. ANC 3882]MCH7313117.1 SRPBCC family protein [Acinetobacter sp. ANC 3882]